MIKKLKQSGFTLMEVMIGVAILSGLSLVMYTTVNNALLAKQRIDSRDQILQTTRVSLNLMIQDLSMAMMANQELLGKEQSSGFKGSENELHFSTFSHFHYLKNGKDSDQVSVSYTLKDNEQGSKNIIRRESSYLTKEIDEGGRSYVILEGVKEVKFEFYDSNRNEWVSEWNSESLSSLKRLPQAVKISLKVLEYENEESEEVIREYPFSTIAKIPLYKDAVKF
jgi:general secretion pathway protein J